MNPLPFFQHHVVLWYFPPFNTVQFFVNSWHFFFCLLPVFPSVSLCSPQTLLNTWIYAYFLSVFSVVWKSVHYKVRSQLLSELSWKKYTSPSDPKHHLQSQNRITNRFVCGEGTIGCIMEKKMAIHSSIVAWRIPGTAEPGGLPSMGSHRVGHDWSNSSSNSSSLYLLIPNSSCTPLPPLCPFSNLRFAFYVCESLSVS